MKNSKVVIVIIALVITMILIGLWILNVSQVGPLVFDLDSYTRMPPEGTDSFKVMNLNMLHGFPRFEHLSERLDLIAEQINQISPDIVTLQEVPWTWRTRSAAAYLAKRTGMNYVYLPANGNRWAIFFSEGEAIFSKFELKDIEFKELRPRAGFFEHRVALKATTATPWGDIHVISTHLTNGDPAINQGQVHDLLEFVMPFGNRSTIVAGDFNALEDSPQIRFLANEWIDTFRQSNPEEPGFTCCIDELTGPGIDRVLEKRIDYLFLIPHRIEPDTPLIDSLRVFDHPYSINNTQLWISDHIGILTTIEVAP